MFCLLNLVFMLDEPNSREFAMSRSGNITLTRSGGGMFENGAFVIPSAEAPGGLRSAFPAPFAFDVGANDFTVMFWFATTSTNTAPTVMVSKRYPGRVHQPGWAVGIVNGKPFVSLAADTQTVSVESTLPAVNDGRWHHVAAVRDTLERTALLLFVDGKLAGQITEKHPFSINTKASFAIGAWFDATPVDESFAGSLRAVQFISRALTSTEVFEAAESASARSQNSRLFTQSELNRVLSAEATKELALLLDARGKKIAAKRTALEAEHQAALFQATSLMATAANATKRADDLEKQKHSVAHQAAASQIPEARLAAQRHVTSAIAEINRLRKLADNSTAAAAVQVQRSWEIEKRKLRINRNLIRYQLRAARQRLAAAKSPTARDQAQRHVDVLERRLTVAFAAKQAVRLLLI